MNDEGGEVTNGPNDHRVKVKDLTLHHRYRTGEKCHEANCRETGSDEVVSDTGLDDALLGTVDGNFRGAGSGKLQVDLGIVRDGIYRDANLDTADGGRRRNDDVGDVVSSRRSGSVEFDCSHDLRTSLLLVLSLSRVFLVLRGVDKSNNPETLAASTRSE